MHRLAWTFAARIGDKYQIRLTRPILVLAAWHTARLFFLLILDIPSGCPGLKRSHADKTQDYAKQKEDMSKENVTTDFPSC